MQPGGPLRVQVPVLLLLLRQVHRWEQPTILLYGHDYVLHPFHILPGAVGLFVNKTGRVDRDQELLCAAEDLGVSLGRRVLSAL